MGYGAPTPGHSLPKLLDKVVKALAVEPPRDVYEVCIRLNKFYVATRCLNAWG